MNKLSIFAVACMLATTACSESPKPDAVPTPAEETQSSTNALPPAATNAPAGPKTISLQEMLVIGHSGLKLHSLAMITQGKATDGVDESFLPGFKATLQDVNRESLFLKPQRRTGAAHICGSRAVGDDLCAACAGNCGRYWLCRAGS